MMSGLRYPLKSLHIFVEDVLIPINDRLWLLLFKITTFPRFTNVDFTLPEKRHT